MKASAILTMLCAALATAAVLPQRSNSARQIQDVKLKGPVKDIWSVGNVDKRDIDAEDSHNDNEVKDVDNHDQFDVEDFEAHKGLDKRFKDNEANCRWGGNGPASTLAIRDGMDHINENWGDSDCQVEAGPSKCQRFTCSWDSAIWLCNDTKETLKVPCKEIASVAGDIIDQCAWVDWEPKAQGQIFRSGGDWNVIIGGDSC
ncbi:hypothetical protein G7Z17_g2357 [Cylindrodendrum hubeiense]|uniref:Uncharacterized protein n=1 Tax=Cylindrodendrum hubeiense TaxID=595255 RepID=A0A9P5HN99_9HYPO|nr:hypothetical protein G7Z17_g2357 [Cylindrodendrum hubeiense]